MKNNTLPRIYFLSLLFSALVLPVLGQQTTFMVGFGASGSFYSGDMQGSSGAFQRVYPGGHISLQKTGKGWIRLSVEAGAGKYVATSAQKITAPDGVEPASFILSPFYYGDLKVNLVPFEGQPVQPYLSLGAGLFHFQPKDASGIPLATITNSRLPEESFNTTIFSLPVSSGVRFRMNKSVSLGVEYTLRLTPTDYLDNTGTLGEKDGNDYLQAITAQLFIKLSPTD